MMEIIFLLLLSYSFCEVASELQKYGSIRTYRSNGMVYLNIETFDDSKIYIRFNVYNSFFPKKKLVMISLTLSQMIIFPLQKN